MSETTTSTPSAPGMLAVERYVEFWNATTSDEQRQRAAEILTGDIEYHALVGIMRGTDELIDFRDQFGQHFPDYAFRARTRPDAHHDRARLQWELVVGGESFATGTDVLELDDDGRIRSITGFLDQPPAGFDPHADH